MLISCHGLSKAHGARPLFEGLDFHLDFADRIGIIGANGSGKSTLLRILAGMEEPDQGERIQKKDLRIGFVAQEPAFDSSLTVEQTLISSLAQSAPLAAEDEMERQVRLGMIMSRLGFVDPALSVAALSGGWQKRLALAQALVCDPELLLLDEPTNHLDLQSILWLEQFLRSTELATIIVSHDRTFLERTAGKVMELDPRYVGGLLAAGGGYLAFLEKRAETLQARAQGEQSLANRVRREIEWLRRGPKARSTKAHARIQKAQELIADLNHMRSLTPDEPADIEMTSTGRRSKRLLTLTGVGKAMGGRALFRGLDLLLRPGMRLGLVGKNGSGKTTLLRTIAKEIEPDQGKVHWAEGLKTVHFSQKREALKPAVSLARTLAPEGDSVIYRDQAIHVASWAQRFGFRFEQLGQPVGNLSGGERAKVEIARLMLRPADVLLLDEPTNDLDISTLEVLEESLLEFPGALVMVSHDRYLLDRVCNLMLHLDGQGQTTPIADTAQWEQLLQAPQTDRQPPKPKPERPVRKKGLSYLEKQEFSGMEQTILQAEARLQQAHQALEDPLNATDAEALFRFHQEAAQAKQEVDRLYARWAELDAKGKD